MRDGNGAMLSAGRGVMMRDHLCFLTHAAAARVLFGLQYVVRSASIETSLALSACLLPRLRLPAWHQSLH
jgi:hypothetical protein